MGPNLSWCPWRHVLPTASLGISAPVSLVQKLPADLRHECRRQVKAWIAVPIMIPIVWWVGVGVIHSRIDRWDLTAIKWFADHRTGWLNTATEWGTYLAETIPVIVVLLAAVIVARRLTGGWRTSVFIAFAVGGEKVVYLASSLLVHRARPPLPTLDDTYATSSFPSGHVGSALTLWGAIAIALGVWLGRRWLIAAWTVALAFTLIVAGCRMYRGFHYPSDCISGLIIGAAWLSIIYFVARPLTAGSHARAEHEAHAVASEAEVSGCLVDSAAFKAVGTSDPRPAGSIPVHLRQT